MIGYLFGVKRFLPDGHTPKTSDLDQGLVACPEKTDVTVMRFPAVERLNVSRLTDSRSKSGHVFLSSVKSLRASSDALAWVIPRNIKEPMISA
jgi:hypothetical protein